MSMPGIVIRRLTPSSASAERARSRSMTLRSSPSRSNSRRCRSTASRSSSGTTCSTSHARPSRPAQIGVRAGRDQVRVQDRLNDVLQARALPDDLVATGDLPAQRLGRLIGDPDFRQEAAGIELREHAGVDRIGLDLRMRDEAHLLGVGDHDLLHMRADHARDRRGVAGRFDDDHVLLDKAARKGLRRSRRMSTRPSRLSLPSFQATASAKARWISSPMMRMLAPSGFARSKREPAGNTTPTDPRSRRIRASRKGRPCNELGLSAQRLSAACPHLRAPGAPRPGWAHHTAVLRREQPDEKGTAAHHAG